MPPSAASYKIGLISDTHGRFHPQIPELFTGVDEIWHLGDVCDESILDELRLICPRLTVVQGNNDDGLSYPLSLDLERQGESFHLVHIPPRQVHLERGWLLFGHTHRPCDEWIEGVHIFNPGSAGLANKGAPLSVAILRKEPQRKFEPELILLGSAS